MSLLKKDRGIEAGRPTSPIPRFVLSYEGGSEFDIVQLGRRVVHDLAPVGLVKLTERFVNEVLRARPGSGGMRVVRGPHRVVRAVQVEGADEQRFVDEGGVDLAS